MLLQLISSIVYLRNFSCILLYKIVLGQIKYAYNYESKCSSFLLLFFVCLCLYSFLKKHLKSLLKMYLITTFFMISGRDGWLLLCLWYVFYMTLFLIIFFLHFLITGNDDSYVRYMNRSLTVILFSQNEKFNYLLCLQA